MRDMRRFARGLLLAAVVGLASAGVAWAQSEAPLVMRRVLDGTTADGQLANAAAQIGAVSAADGAVALAGHADHHGNWTFVNGKGERFSVATPDELKRVVSVLAPGGDAARRIVFLLTPDTLFGPAQAWKSLASLRAALRLASDVTTYKVQRRDPLPPLVEVRPTLLVAAKTRAAFESTLWYFARPFERSRMRMIALEAGAPRVLSSSPRYDPKTKDALIDTLDPTALPAALSGLGGQTAVLSGRIEGDALVGLDAKGRLHRVALAPLLAAGVAADVGVVVMAQSNPAQMGGRNWLYQRVEVKGLTHSAGGAAFGEFLDALTMGEQFVVTAAERAGDGRIDLDIQRSGSSAPGDTVSRLSRMVRDLASEAMGKVPVIGVRAVLPAVARQQELDRRWVSWLPSSLTRLYAVLLAAGLIGWPVAMSWFQRIWPGEQRRDYANAFGYGAAHGLRAAVFALVFAPLAAFASAPLRLLGLVKSRLDSKRGGSVG